MGGSYRLPYLTFPFPFSEVRDSSGAGEAGEEWWTTLFRKITSASPTIESTSSAEWKDAEEAAADIALQNKREVGGRRHPTFVFFTSTSPREPSPAGGRRGRDVGGPLEPRWPQTAQ